jgi:hypothetical protein
MLILAIGSVIANLNNIFFIYQSIYYRKHQPTDPNASLIVIYNDKDSYFYFILYFVCNSLTRLVSGSILDILIRRKIMIDVKLLIE